LSLKLQIIAAACSLILLIFIYELVRRKHLKENYSLTWFSVAGGFLLLSIFGNSLNGIVASFGFQQVSNAIIVYAIFLLLILILGLSVAVTRLSNLSQKMAQDIGLMKRDLEEKRQKEEG
jgi:hypothetical protein